MHLVFVFVSVLTTVCLVYGNANRNDRKQSMISLPDQNGAGLSYCKITTRDLTSTIQNTAYRVLKGACNPVELDKKMLSLETQIVDQFNDLKSMVLNIEDKMREHNENISRKNRKLYKTLIKKAQRQEETQNTNVKAIDIPSPSVPREDEDAIYTDLKKTISGHSYDEKVVRSTRDNEIAKLNSTTHVLHNGSTVFTYYWRVGDLRRRMSSWASDRSAISNGFYVFQYGYRMYLRIFPNSEGNHVYVKVGIAKGDYDDTLVWPFQLKLKLQILDHRADGEDITSRVWNPADLCSTWNWKRPHEAVNDECVGLGFPQELLRSRNYLHDDGIVVKLTVYLD